MVDLIVGWSIIAMRPNVFLSEVTKVLKAPLDQKASIEVMGVGCASGARNGAPSP
jgi:hypothetical protein